MKEKIYGTGFRGQDMGITFGYAFDGGEEVFITYRETDKRGEELNDDLVKELSSRWTDVSKRFTVGKCKECGSWRLNEQQVKNMTEKWFDYKRIAKLLDRISRLLRKSPNEPPNKVSTIPVGESL